MKIGIEVEGRFKGVPTLFCGAHEYLKGIAEAKKHGVSHIYISDNKNRIAYDSPNLASCGLLVTLDITEVRACADRPENVTLMLRVDGHAQVRKLQHYDQIKFEAKRNVLVAPVNSLYRTYPHEFAKDRTI